MQKNHRLSLALALALGSSEVLALGLGGIRVGSGLNEPLSAEIPIISSSPAELAALQVRLASADAFSRIGIDRASLLPANLTFTVTKNAAGQPVIRVTTPNRLGEPIVNFLLEVEWGRGRMLREYTVLLDPPKVAVARTQPAVTAPAREPASARTEALPPPPMSPPARPAPAAAPAAAAAPSPAPTAQPAAQPPRPAPAPAPAPSFTGDSFGPVAAGQTLWSIAQQVRPDSSVSMNQTMLALLRANPDAFVGNNINRLKRGAVLRIPSRDELAALTAAAAAAEVAEQARAWRDSPAAPVRDTVSVPSEPVRQVEAARPKPAATTSTDSRLELLPPGGDKPASGAQSGTSTTGGGTELRADLSRAREQVATLEQENRDLRSRVSDLERIDGDTKRLIELKDSQLAEAQARLAELEAERSRQEGLAAPAPAVEGATGGDQTPVAGSDDPASSEDPIAEAQDPATDAGLDEMAPAGAVPPPVEEPAVVQPVADPVPTPTVALDEPAPAATPWYLQPMALLGGLLVLVAGILALLFARRRNPAAESASSRPSIADRYVAATAAPVAVPPALADQADDYSAEDSEEDQLLVAVGEQPNDLGRHLALVSFYYRNSDSSGFEGAAEAMYAQLYDAEHPSWKQVVAMGRDLLPDHPLFFEVPASPPPAEPAATTRFESVPAPAASKDDDWGVSPAAAANNETTQNFSVQEIDRLRSATSNAGSPFDTQKFKTADVKIEPMDFDLDEGFSGEEAGDESSDEAAATKLELARAYLDMGDVEGARGMLEEVVSEGNPGQRAEAKRLLDEVR